MERRSSDLCDPVLDGDTAGGAVTDATLVDRLGHDFGRPELLETALTHASYCAEHLGCESNQRLEFLGDAVLGLVVTLELYQRYPDLPEGKLAKIRAAVVSADALTGMARRIDLGPELRLGKGEVSSGGHDKPSILADAMEAVLGALYLDAGAEPVRRLVLDQLKGDLIRAADGPGGEDFKSQLQELAAPLWPEGPTYHHLEEGPDHARRFVATVSFGGHIRGTGEGSTKKRAEQEAAASALFWLRDYRSAHHSSAGSDEQDG